jgi:ALG6, ALG8 glycosyltransferase family
MFNTYKMLIRSCIIHFWSAPLISASQIVCWGRSIQCLHCNMHASAWQCVPPSFVQQLTGAFSLYPLLKREGLAVPYYTCVISYAVGACFMMLKGFKNKHMSESLSAVSQDQSDSKHAISATLTQKLNYSSMVYPYHVTLKQLLRLAVTLSLTAMLLLHIVELAVRPPKRYPDIFPVLNLLLSCSVFSIGYGVCVLWLWTLPPATRCEQLKKSQ